MPNTVYIKQSNGTYKKVKYIEKNVNGSLSLIEDVLPKGATGSQGLNGEPGLNGIDGANGRHGLNGLDGLNGLNGVNGLDGYTPQKGIDYFDGEMGLQGQQGEMGLKGEQGEVGPQGEKGDKGDKGDVGLQGPKGDKGDKGETGLQGRQGEKGDKGLQGLRGPQGLTGETGLIGATGATGPAGRPGKDGRNGMMGPMGPQGPKGDSGTGGGSQFRFVDTLVEIKPGEQQVAYDLFITDKLIVKGADKTYTIGSETFSNDALLNVKKDIWLDGTLEVNGILTFDLPEMPIPAHINYFDFSSGLTTVITISNTWYKLNTNTTSIFSHDGFVHTNNRITNTGVKKRIKMSGIASASAGNNDVIHFAFFINGQLWPCSEQEIVTSSGGRSSACPFHCVAELMTNDYVEVFVKNANASTNIILDNVNVIITELQY